jgi:hypothetical protein
MADKGRADAVGLYFGEESSYGGGCSALYRLSQNGDLGELGSRENLIDNPSVFSDGFGREPVRGNVTVQYSLPLLLQLSEATIILKHLLDDPTTTNPQGTTATIQTAGTGLSDITTGGTYSGDDPSLFEIQIDGTGTPDTFKWRQDRGSWTETVNITGAAQTLADDVTATFDETTGHTSGDSWMFWATPSGTYAHMYSPMDRSDAPLPNDGTNVAACIEVQHTDLSDIYHQCTGVKLNSLELPIDQEGPLGITLGIMGEDSSIESSSWDATPTEYDDDVISHRMLGTIYVAGTAVAAVSNGSLSLMNNMTAGRVAANSGLVADIIEGRFSLGYNLNTWFANTTFYDYAANFTTVSAEMRWTNSQNADELLWAFIPEIKFPRTPPNIRQGGVELNLQGQGFVKDLTKPIYMVLFNTVSSI